ncbi:glycosyltransferase family 9 protein [Acidihalobacter prosperus]|uniref:Glycosyl transferase family 9 n=1 Tax=Acidihalobacter prosperus TaxID=160660 RepID=A0A1A6C4Z2_9GAMM|nr:glycosyltransferase family 9 protein [Acidihalobacter prosperus]OBS09619.1 hypothetical protein Thpro_021947 [Acidihalobacter prosperus]
MSDIAMPTLDVPTRPRILVIRRDNIGDLVCTLPMITALRRRYPEAHIAALVNSYNRDVLAGHPDLDAVYAYTKAKHREDGESVAGVYWRRIKLTLHLRRERFDYAVLGGAHFLPRALRLARPLGARHIVGFTEPGRRGAGAIDTPVPYGSGAGMHEVEDIFRLLAPFGIEGPPPAARLAPDAVLADAIRTGLPAAAAGRPLVGLHVSARKPSNRWPVERFVELARRLHEAHGAHFLLFWSPGAPDDRFHPGDDDKADHLAAVLGPDLLTPCRTERLAELIAGLSLCDRVICSDGGAMHIAAALERPIVCLFGATDPVRWHPWATDYRLLQTPARDVSDVDVDAVLVAFSELMSR